ncbi:MAG: hypothetical protein Q9160_005690 [Pyrenula sp. 1 TL-2023]
MSLADPDSHEILALALTQKLWQATFKQEPWINDEIADTPEYEEMITIGEEIVRSFTPDYPYFRTDSYVICPLSFVGMFCKAPTRRKAINLLRRIHWKEGVWDSQEIADILEAAFYSEGKDGSSGGIDIENEGTLNVARRLLSSGLLPTTKHNGIVELAKSKTVPLTMA